MFGFDVATGTIKYESSGEHIYRTSGPLEVRNVTEDLPPMPEILCYIFDVGGVCTPDQQYALRNGTAVIHDYYVGS